QILQGAYQSQLNADLTMSQALSQAATNFQALGKTNFTFNLGIVQFDSLFVNWMRDKTAGKIFANGASAVANALREGSIFYLNEADKIRASLTNINTAIAQQILNPKK